MFIIAKTKKEIQKDYLKRSGYAPIERYNKKAYDRTMIRLYKGELEQVKARAAELGKSLNRYIGDLISEDLKNK